MLLAAALFVLGLVIGSFLNVVVYRLPLMIEREWLGDAAAYLQDGGAMGRVLGATTLRTAELARHGERLAGELADLPRMNLARPRSRCGTCGTQLGWHENVPVMSWLLLRGKCASCGNPISARYLVVELLTGLLFAALAWRSGPTAATAVYGLAVSLLLAGALIDLDTTLLPDNLTLPLVGLGLVAAWLHWTPLSLHDAALGALFGYLSLWLVASAYRLLRGVQGMAEGDFKMLAGLGALLGWQALPAIILLASAVGAAVGIYLIAMRGHQREVPIPFGPYLAGGGLVALFFGARLSAMWPGL